AGDGCPEDPTDRAERRQPHEPRRSTRRSRPVTSRPARPVRLRRETIALVTAMLAHTSVHRARWVADLLGRERAVTRSAIDRPAVLEALHALNLVAVSEDRIEPLARVDVVGRLLIASDLQRLRRARDFVGGPGPA